MMILDEVRTIIAKIHELDVSKITPDTDLYEDLDDSLDAVAIYMACEETFDLEISDDDVEAWNMRNARNITAYLEYRLGKCDGA